MFSAASLDSTSICVPKTSCNTNSLAYIGSCPAAISFLYSSVSEGSVDNFNHPLPISKFSPDRIASNILGVRNVPLTACL